MSVPTKTLDLSPWSLVEDGHSLQIGGLLFSLYLEGFVVYFQGSTMLRRATRVLGGQVSRKVLKHPTLAHASVFQPTRTDQKFGNQRFGGYQQISFCSSNATPPSQQPLGQVSYKSRIHTNKLRIYSFYILEPQRQYIGTKVGATVHGRFCFD